MLTTEERETIRAVEREGVLVGSERIFLRASHTVMIAVLFRAGVFPNHSLAEIARMYAEIVADMRRL